MINISNNVDQQYNELVKRIITLGRMVNTRNGNRLTAYGAQLRFPLDEGFPILTTKKVAFRLVASELCWFLNGGTNTAQLHEWDNHIWDANADENGELGPIYGYQWRSYGGSGLDQIARSIDLLRKAPASTRNVVIAWNPIDMDKMKLPPCHFGFQLHVDGDYLHLQASMRSVDVMVGLPFNISSYALLCHLFAKAVNLYPGELIMDLGNIHIYEPHIENANIQVEREPYALPALLIDSPIPGDLRSINPNQFSLYGYSYHPSLKYQMIA